MTESIPLEKTAQTEPASGLCHDSVARLCEWFGRLLGFQVPVGYEDETGLHLEKNLTALN